MVVVADKLNIVHVEEKNFPRFRNWIFFLNEILTMTQKEIEIEFLFYCVAEFCIDL